MDGNAISALVLLALGVLGSLCYFVHRLFEHVEIMGGKRTPAEWKRKENARGEDVA